MLCIQGLISEAEFAAIDEGLQTIKGASSAATSPGAMRSKMCT